MEKTIVSVKKMLNYIHEYLAKKVEWSIETIDYYFLTPEEIFNFIGVESNKDNVNNFIEAVSLCLKRSIKQDNGVKSWTDMKHFADDGDMKYLETHPKCTSKEYQLKYFNDYNMHLDEFKIGDKFIFGDGSYCIDLTLPVGKHQYETDMDRELERDAEFEVVEEPYFAIYDYRYTIDPLKSERFVTIKSLKTGKIYRAYAGHTYSQSIVSSEFLDRDKHEDFWFDDYDDYDYYDDYDD